MAVNVVSQPFYDNSSEEYHDKNYRQILFTSGRAVQCRELTGIGSFSTEHIREIANLSFKEGTILNGCNVKAIDRTPRTDYPDAISGMTIGLVMMNGGRVFVDGYPFEIEFNKFPAVSKEAIPIRLTGPEIIYVEVLDSVITSLEDESLIDPASGYDNYEAPGAHRLQRIARFISTAHKDYNTPGNIRVPVVELLDGKMIYDASADAKENETATSLSSETNVLDVLSQRTFETSGNYLVNGFKVKTYPCLDNTKVGLTVSPGVAYINGRRVDMQSAYKGYLDKVLVTSLIQNEEKPVVWKSVLDNNGDPTYQLDGNGDRIIEKRYKMGLSPVAKINEAAVPIIGKRQLIYNASSISYISGVNGSVNKILKCYVPTSYEVGEGDPESLPNTYIEFKEGIDFRFENSGILWLSTGQNPMSLPEGVRGTLFWVTFIYKSPLVSSDYHIEYASKREATLKIPVVNGEAKIPSQFYNPSVKSVKNPYVADGTGFLALNENSQWYHNGGTINIATNDFPTIPLRVERRSNTDSDTIGITGAVLKSAKFFSENGIESYKMDNLFEAKPDFRFYSETGIIEWLNTKPPVGEAYIVEAGIPNGLLTNFGSSSPMVEVNFTYENISDIYDNTTHDSYLVVHDNVKLSRSEAGGDNITLSYEAARSRTTSVCLDKAGNIKMYHGTVIDQNNNLTPTIPSDSLVIADTFIKPTTSTQYQIVSHNNYRMRMTDLRDMFDRLKNVEYNLALSDIEKEAESKLPGQTLRGVFTDAFMSVKKSDNSMVWNFIKDQHNQAIPLITEGRLSPNYRKYCLDLKVDAAKTTAGLYNNVYMMSKNYSQEVWLRQPYGTTIRSAAEGLDLMQCFPSITIDPDNDYFVENEIGVVMDPDPNGNISNESGSLITKNCYILNANSAALISDGSIPFPTTANSVVTVQFWMYSQTNAGMPFSFNGTGTPKPTGANIWFSQNHFGVNTYGGEVTGIKNEQIQNFWRHVTVIFKCKTPNATNIELYINGDKQRMSTVVTNNVGYNPAYMIFGNKVRLGGSFKDPKNYYWKGKLADLRVWNRALTVAEIQDTMTRDLAGNENGLVGWWHEKIVDNKIVDSQTNGTKHDLIMTPNGGHTENTSTSTIGYEVRSFAELVSGNSDTNSANIKNILDLTAGNVPDEQIEYILDPTKNKITSKDSYGYVTKDINLGAQRNTAALGGVTWDAYNVEKTYYEKVITQQTEVLGEFVTDVAPVAMLRKRVVTIKGKGFLENTDLLAVTFDGIPVKLCKLNDYNATTDGAPSTGTDSDRYWKTNSNGEFRCGFVIPDNVPIGVREVQLTAPGAIQLKAQYWGAGMTASKLTLTNTNETITWEPRTVNIGTEYQNKDGWILVDGWDCRSRCGTTPLCQTFYVNDSSLTKPVIKDIGTNSDVFLTSVDVFFRTAGDCRDLIAGFVELTDSGVPRSDSGAGPSRFVGGVNVFDSRDINMTVGDPSRGTAAHNIKWENLVPLKGGKGYGFIVGSTDGNTTMWIASIENSTKNTDIATGQAVINESDRGILLSSPNGQTWATYIYDDMKYTFYVANFFNDNKLKDAPASMRPSKALSTTGKVSYIEYQEVDIKARSNNNLSEMNFFIYNVNAQNSNDGSGYVIYEYDQQDMSGNWSNQWTGFTPGSTVYLSRAIQKIKIRLSLYSFNPYSTPIVARDSSLICGQFVLPSTYTSITGTVGEWNTAEVYIDKFMDENLSDIDLFVSPDQGYTWHHMNNPVSTTPILQQSSVYNGEAINQFRYQFKLEVQTPVIEELTVTNTGVPGDFPDLGDYEFAIALVDAQGNETELSNKVTKTINHVAANLNFKVKFDPNATGFRIYARLLNQPDLYLWYDSTAIATLREDLPSTTTTAELYVESNGVSLPHKGMLMIGNEYIRYNAIDKMLDDDNLPFFKLSGTEFMRAATHVGRESVLGAHPKGSEVMLINEGFLQQESPTACVSGVWRMPSYTRNVDQTWTFNYVSKDLLRYRADLKEVNPNYDEDIPANYTSENVTFRIEMKDKQNAENVDTLDRIPYAGRVMITVGLEEY